jgi:adenylate cyclase
MAESHLTSLQSPFLFGRRLRLASGIVMFTYVATHLANHAAGLVSLQAAEAVRLWFLLAWRSIPLTTLFYAAMLSHIVLALVAIHERRTLRIPSLELARIALGLCIPLLLASHFAGTRLAHELLGRDDSYALVVTKLWANDKGLHQLTLMCIAWFHGCLGLHFVLRHRPFYGRRFHLFFAACVLLPVLAALGFAAMAHEMQFTHRFEATQPVNEKLERTAEAICVAYGLAIALVMAARGARSWREHHRGLTITLAYPARSVRVPRGWSVLEASRAHAIPHVSLCGGRARCSTCRVRVSADPAYLPAPSAAERATLQRIGADPQVRLACQLRPTGDIAVVPVLRAQVTEVSGRQAGVEHDVVVLFVDLRRWTTLAERHLPHDLAYVLEQFFEVVGEAVRQAGGIPNQFIGDSVMAIFGIDSDKGNGYRQALAAARLIESGIEQRNERLKLDFGHSFEFGIGIHAGRAVVGEVGWEDIRTLTAVGDPVNTAARLQELCKTYGVRLIVSEKVLNGAGVNAQSLARHTITVRGRSDHLAIYAVPSPALLEPSTTS